MARGIVRYSFNADGGSRFTNQVRGALEARGFDRAGRTGSLEVRGADLDDVIDAVKDGLDVIKTLTDPVELDHVWLYIDGAD